MLYGTRLRGNVLKQINIFPVRMWFILLSALSVVWIIKHLWKFMLFNEICGVLFLTQAWDNLLNFIVSEPLTSPN